MGCGNTAVCKVCGAEYELCAACEKSRSWRIHTDTLEHYRVLCICMEYQMYGDADKAYKSLLNAGADLHDMSAYTPSAAQLIGEISQRAGKMSSLDGFVEVGVRSVYAPVCGENKN